MNYLAVRNWKRHQHYKDRKPPWIKFYVKLLEDPEFSCLQDASKLQLVLIWLLAAKYENRIPYNEKWIKRMIGVDCEVDLEPLISAGFLMVEQDASKMLANSSESATTREQSTECTDKKEKVEKEKAPDSSPPPAAGADGSAAAAPAKPKKSKAKKSTPEDPRSVPVPTRLDTPAFKASWEKWIADRARRKKPMTELAARMQLGKLERFGPEWSISRIEKAIMCGWQGLIFDDDQIPPESNDEREPCEAPPGQIEFEPNPHESEILQRLAAKGIVP